MAFLLSPNMSLPVPAVGSEAGPNYAVDVNSSLSLLDQHDHSPGRGVQITPAGLNINSALTINGNFLQSAAGVIFTPQTVQPANGTVYESGVDLFYVDGLGNNIQLTASGGIAGTNGSIANLTPPASATYVSASKTFVFQSAASIAANVDAASVLIRNISPNSTNAITIQAPASLATSYGLTLPSLPGSLSLMALDASGNISAPYSISGGLNASVLTPASVTQTQMANNSIGTNQIIDASVTQVKRAALGQAISASCDSFNVPPSLAPVPNLNVSITTTGRPVSISMISDGTNRNTNTGVSSGVMSIIIFRDSTIIANYLIASSNGQSSQQPGCIYTIDPNATAGNHTYSVQAQYNSFSSGTGGIEYFKLFAYEL